MHVKYCCCYSFRLRVDKASLVIAILNIVIRLFIFPFNYMFDDGNGNLIMLDAFMAVANILLCCAIIVGYFKRCAELYLPYLFVNAIVTAVVFVATIVILHINPQRNDPSNYWEIVYLFYLVLSIWTLRIVYRAYKMLKLGKNSAAGPSERLQSTSQIPTLPPSSPTTPIASISYSNSCMPPPIYNLPNGCSHCAQRGGLDGDNKVVHIC